MTVPSAEKMFSLLKKIKPDLILLDIQMPVMDGFEALELLKADETWVDIPVLFLTGTTDAIIEEKSTKLGALCIITKPFSTPVLLEVIKTHLNKKSV
jgi:putative two-component system response regulator